MSSDAPNSESESRVSADENLCHSCGYNETPARKNYRKCPECGAPFLGRYVQRTFGRTDVGVDADE